MLPSIVRRPSRCARARRGPEAPDLDRVQIIVVWVSSASGLASYSSHFPVMCLVIQREASIDDQIRICRAEIERKGCNLIQVYADAAISAASTLHPGYRSSSRTRQRRHRCRGRREPGPVVAGDLADVATQFSISTRSSARIFKDYAQAVSPRPTV